MAQRADQLVAELARAIADWRVLEAIRAVPRDAFVPPHPLRYGEREHAASSSA